MGTDDDLYTIWWTEFAVFEASWIFVVLVVLVLYWAKVYVREYEKVVKEGGERIKVREKRGSTFGTKGSVVVLITYIVLLAAAGFMALSFVAEGKNLGKQAFAFRANSDVVLGGCTVDLANDGTCALLLRPIWYVVLFAIYSFLATMVFGFTIITTAMFMFGSITLAIGLTLATYSNVDATEWTAWSLSVFGALWSIGWSLWAWLDLDSAAIFLGKFDLAGSPLEKKKIKLDKIPALKKYRELTIPQIPGIAKAGEYWEFANPFAGDAVLLIFWVVNSIAFLWFACEWLVGPLAPVPGGYGILDDAGIMFGSDIVLFGIIPLGLLTIWYTYDPGKLHRFRNEELAKRRRKYWIEILGRKAEERTLTEEQKKRGLQDPWEDYGTRRALQRDTILSKHGPIMSTHKKFRSGTKGYRHQ